jgi:LacI family transcriptional regulator
MKFSPVTIKDIAHALNLSSSTVSRALRDSYEINEETKKVVTDYAKSINYRPNPSALNLKERRSHTIGVVVAEIANSFFSQVINGIESVAQQRGYNVIITQTFENYEKEVEILYNLAQSVDGMLISLSAETTNMEHIQTLHEKGMSIVFFDRVDESLKAHKVISNNYKSAFDATTYLLDNGYKRIALIGHDANLSITRERKKGYTDALKVRGITLPEKYMKFCTHGGLVFKEVEDSINQLLKISPQPDSIFSGTDKITTGSLRILQQKNIRIPEDIALIGFSNSELTDLLTPSLSVIKQDAHTMGARATELLIKQIESKRPVLDFEEIILDTVLHIRSSTERARREKH